MQVENSEGCAGQVPHGDVHRGRAALVTGGGTGIGRAVALDLARCGADVIIAGRRSEPLEKTAAEIEWIGARALAVPVDIRDDDQVGSMVDQALERFGRIDTLVNNAGGQFSAPAEEITGKSWRAVHRLAVDATWAVTQEVAVRAMIPQRSGVVFFMAFSPRRGIPSMVHATSARAALENLASSLALEWSRYGIRTICIAPGTIATEGIEQNYTAEDRAQWEAAVLLGRLCIVEDVSGVIAFLASPAARYVTVSTVVVDGGADAWGRGVPGAVSGGAAVNTVRNLTALFDPKSVAVLGASNDETKCGNWLSVQAVRMADKRAVHLVNRRGESILGRPALRCLAELEINPCSSRPTVRSVSMARIVLES